MPGDEIVPSRPGEAPGPRSNEPLFDLRVAELPLRVLRLHGQEAISELFEFRIEVASVDFDPEALLGRDALLTIHSAEAPRSIHGIIAEAEHIGQTKDLQLHELTLVPAAHRLTLRQGCRAFQDRTTEQIVTEVLTAGGIPRDGFRFELAERYAPRDYCVQYCETDLAFISRLLEEDGIFYFFEHEEDRHVLVMADQAQACLPIEGDPALWFRPPAGLVAAQEHVQAFRFGGRMRPGKVSLRDFNLHRPDLSLEVTEAGKLDPDLEIYHYPGEYQDPGRAGPHQGHSMAKIRLEELQSSRRFGSGTSDCPRLTAGRTMRLFGHAKDEFNTEYRLMQVRHSGTQSQEIEQDASTSTSYHNSFRVTELEWPYRPPRRTPRPVMRGVQTATVVGPEGEEVYTDRHGRVRLHFHWERGGKRDENSATWVRVSQVWAGNGFGGLFLPRIGHEVLVDFIEGDPDRPVVVGRLYHGNNEPPYPLPEERTKSTLRSESSPGGGGFNELRFEDRKGSEEVFLHAQKDWNTQIGNDLRERVGADRSATIGGDDTTLVEKVHSVTIAQPSAPPPTIPPTGTTMQDTFISATTGTARIVINGSDVFIVAAGNISLAAGGDVTLSAGGAVDIASGGPASVIAGGTNLVLKGPMVKIN